MSLIPGVPSWRSLTRNLGRLSLPIVLLVWLAMTSWTLALTVQYGSNVPSWDDWDMVPTMVGVQPVTLEWLWSQHNEHRLPVPRLVMLALYRTFGPDFRVGMYCNVALMSLLSLALVLTARRVRGRSSCTDGFIPIVLLNWSQAANFLWGGQIEFFLSTFLAGIVLIVMATIGERPSRRGGFLTAALLVLLAGTGAHGVVLLPAVAAWLGLWGLIQWRRGPASATRDGLVQSILAATCMALFAAYFVHYSPVPYHPPWRGPRAMLGTSVKFLAMGLGTSVVDSWPFPAAAILVIMMAVGASLVKAVIAYPAIRCRATALLAFFGAMSCLALAMGMGRNGFEPRYITLSVPMICGLYLSPLAVDPWSLIRYVHLPLTVLAAGFLPGNTLFGVFYSEYLRTHLRAFEVAMESGVPRHRLIRGYHEVLHPHDDILADYMPLLRRAQVGSFRWLKDDPPRREISFRSPPKAAVQARWDGGLVTVSNGAYLDFELPEEKLLHGIRLKYHHKAEGGTLPYLGIFWKNENQAEFRSEQYVKYSPTGDRANWRLGTWLRLSDPDPTMTVWLGERVRQIRVIPDLRPCTVQFLEFTLLAPADAGKFKANGYGDETK